MIYRFFFILLCLFFFATCKFLTFSVKTVTYGQGCQKNYVGPGPEDFVYDQKNKRLIISSLERRTWSKTGEIYSFDIHTHKVRLLKRTGEPKGFYLRPHGISLTRNKKLDLLLYVISHNQKTKDDLPKETVVIYKLVNNTLQFIRFYRDSLLHSPNDLFALPSGEIYLTNDRKNNQSFLETFLLIKNGNLVFYNNNHWRKIVAKVGFANGIHVNDRHIFLSSTYDDLVYHYKLKDDRKLKLIHQYSISAPDNIQMNDKNEIIVVSHLNPILFLLHANDPSNYSPSLVYKIDTVKNKKEIIYANSGQEISGASAALEIDNTLYIAQSLGNFLLVCR